MEVKSSSQYSSGFTIIELMVTIAIFGIISSLVLVKMPKFNQNISLKRTMQDVALAVREAQVFALGVREFSSQFPGYGTYFDLGAPTAFSVFADLDADKRQTSGGQEIFDTFNITTGDTIVDLCGDKRSGGVNKGCGLATLDISFLRPSPVATLLGPSGVEFSDIAIVVQSRGGVQREIVVWKTGQISIEEVAPL